MSALMMTERAGRNFCLNCFADRDGQSGCPQCGYTGEKLRPNHALPAGTLLQGRYLVGRILRGACNEFTLSYRATDIRTRAHLAIKEYFPRDLARRLEGAAIAGPLSPREAPSYSFGLKSFIGEARELRALFHPHVISTRHIFEENGTAYVVEDFCAGQTLADVIGQTSGPFPEGYALELAACLLDVIEAAHNRQLPHLDIRPENILIKPSGEPLLVGFSASRIALAERTLSLPALPGSPFIPIERYLSSREMGPWTDIYSIAAILYRLLTASNPPEADERSVIDRLVPIAEHNPDASSQIAVAITEGMRVNRKDRPQTIGEFRRALLPDSISPNEDDPDEAPTSSVWGRTGKTVFGHVAKIGFALGSLVYLAILSYIGFTSLWHSPKKPAPPPASEQSAAEAVRQAPETLAVPQAPILPEPPLPTPGPGNPEPKAATPSGDFQAILIRANSGTPEDWLSLAKAYENGEGTPRNMKKALKWYRLSAERNMPEAQAALGRIYVTGRDGQHNRTEGVGWYRRAAEHGSSDAQFALGTLYELGLGVPRNMAEALRWYRAAGDGGHPMAQNRLGKLYDEGQGGIKDDAAAIAWYRRAAEQGDADAQFNLALMYENGEGVDVSRAEALRWLERAAAAGNADAKALLKKLSH